MKKAIIFMCFIVLIMFAGCFAKDETKIKGEGVLEDENYVEIREGEFSFELKNENGEKINEEIYLKKENDEKILEVNRKEEGYSVKCTEFDEGEYNIYLKDDNNFQIENNHIIIKKQKKKYENGEIEVVMTVNISDDLFIKEIQENQKIILSIKLINVKILGEYKIKIYNEKDLLKTEKFENGITENVKVIEINLEKLSDNDYNYEIYLDEEVINNGNFIIISNAKEREILPHNNIIIDVTEKDDVEEEKEISDEIVEKEEEEEISDKIVEEEEEDNPETEDESEIFYGKIPVTLGMNNENIKFSIKEIQEENIKIYFENEMLNFELKTEEEIKKIVIDITIEINDEKFIIEGEKIFKDKMEIELKKNNKDIDVIIDGKVKKLINIIENLEKYKFKDLLIQTDEKFNFLNYDIEGDLLMFVSDKIKKVDKNNIYFKETIKNIEILFICENKMTTEANFIFGDLLENKIYQNKIKIDFDKNNLVEDVFFNLKKVQIKNGIDIEEKGEEGENYYKIRTYDKDEYGRRVFLYTVEEGEYKYLRVFEMKDLYSTEDKYLNKNSFYFEKKDENRKIDQFVFLVEEKVINRNGIREKLMGEVYIIDFFENVKFIGNEKIKEFINSKVDLEMLNGKKIEISEYLEKNDEKYLSLSGKVFLKNLLEKNIKLLYTEFFSEKQDKMSLLIKMKIDNDLEEKGLYICNNVINYNQYFGKKNEEIFFDIGKYFLENNIENGEISNQNNGYLLSGEIWKTEEHNFELTNNPILYKSKKIGDKKYFLEGPELEKNNFKNNGLNFREKIYIIEEKRVYPVITDLSFYLQMGIMDRFNSKGNEVFDTEFKEEFSDFNFLMPEVYTKVYQIYNDNSLYSGSKLSKMRIKQGEVTSGYGNFGQNYKEKKLEKTKIETKKGLDAYNWDTKEYIAAAAFLIDVIYAKDIYNDIKHSEYWKAIPEALKWIMDNTENFSNLDKKAISKKQLTRYLIQGVNLFTLYNLKFESMWEQKKEEVKYYYTSEKNWTDIFSSDKYNLSSCLNEDSAAKIFSLSKEDREKLIERMLNPNDVNYCNIWEMYIYVKEKDNEKYQILDILPNPSVKAPGDVRIRILYKLSSIKDDVLFQKAYENKDEILEVREIAESEDEKYNEFKKGNDSILLSKGWYKLNVKLEKIGTTDMKKPDGWGVIMPINANIYKGDDELQFYIPEYEKPFICELSEKFINEKYINDSLNENIFLD